MSTQFHCQKHFYFKLFSLFKQLHITIQFSVSRVSMSKTVQFQTGKQERKDEIIKQGEGNNVKERIKL